jgi:two-component system response regulator AlgR
MNILIADDEAPARTRLRSLLQGMAPSVEVVGEAADGEAVLAFCRARPVDLVLLDIRMPGMDGIQAALHLAELAPPPAVIFTTASEEHALAAFDADAIDYLLKPIRRERLQAALLKARRLSEAQHAALLEQDAYLLASFRGGVQRIPLSTVRYLRADSKYVEVGHVGGEALVEESLRSIEARWPGRFERVHRNALVTPSFVRALEKGPDGRMLLRISGSARPLEVSRRHLPAVRRWLKGA